MKKIGIALIAILLCTSLLIACTPGYTMDRLFSFLGGSATSGNAYATDGNVIFVSAGNVVSFGNAPVVSGGNAATSGNAAPASSGNAPVATSGNAALPNFTVVDTPATPSPTPARVG